MFGPEDRGAAAAAACYDLGESLARHRGGSKVENLQEAERLFRRALESSSRKRDPLRLALTHDALGRVLRRLANRAEGEEADRLRREAIRQIARACEIVEAIGPVGWLPAGEYYTNLGNALGQHGEVDDALRAHERSLQYMRAAGEHRDHPLIALPASTRGRSWLALPLMNLAAALSDRGRPADLDRAADLCREAQKDGAPPEVMQARLRLAEIDHQRGRDDLAVQSLVSVDAHILPDEHLVRLADLMLACGDAARAVATARQGILKAMEARSGALADHLADHEAARAQRFGVLAARAWIVQEKPVEAFLAIENVSGLRYYDSVSRQARTMPEDPVACAVATTLQAHSLVAQQLDEAASRMAYLPEQAQRETLRAKPTLMTEALAQVVPVGGSPGSQEASTWLRADLESAAQRPSPVVALREAAQRHFRRRQDLDAALNARGTPIGKRMPWDDEMSPEVLRSLLAEEQGSAFVRVHLADEVVIAAVWLEEGQLTGRAERREMPDGLLLQILATVAQEEGQAARTALDWGLLSPTLDLTKLVPDDIQHLVILPSLAASLVPWAGIGEGAPLVHRFDALSILPCLLPLWMRQVYVPVREGTLTVAPTDHPGGIATRFHDAALKVELRGETRLLGERATAELLAEHVGSADVVTFYAHGQGGQGVLPGVLLVDGLFAPHEEDLTWYGLERVELWACQSGVNLPDDPLIPYVDDAFRLDIRFHRAGVRSTIGTLWSVPDFVTGCVVARFRRALLEGRLAPCALADAQRWWLDEGVPRLVSLLHEVPEEEAVSAFFKALGTELPSGLCLGGVLGPLPADGRLPKTEIDALQRQLSRPESWAGYRFVGVAERRPVVVGRFELPPLTADQEKEVRRIVEGPPPDRKDIDQWQAEELAAAKGAVDGRSPSPTEAIRVARLFADLRRSAPRHNLLRGLAWLHEALSAPVLEAEERTRLCVEAAWMWLEVARRDTTDERLFGLLPSDPVAAQRAFGLVKDLAPSPDVVVLKAWFEILGATGREIPDIAMHVWKDVRDEAIRATEDAYADLRRCRAVLELALCCRVIPTDAGGVAQQDLSETRTLDASCRFAFHRWELTRTVVLRRLDLAGGDRFDPQFLPHRDVSRGIELRVGGRDDTYPNWASVQRELNNSLALLEYHYWGEPADADGTSWKTTGVPTRAWLFGGGAFLAGQIRIGSSSGRARHHLACLQLGADLRIGPLNTWARTMGATKGRSLAELGSKVWAIEHMLGFLSDAAALLSLTDRGVPLSAPRAEFDPFARSVRELQAAAYSSPLGGTGWLVANSVEDWFQHEANGRTAAFGLEQVVSSLQASVSSSWNFLQRFSDGDLREEIADRETAQGFDALCKALAPGAEIQDMEEELRDLPAYCAILGLTVTPRGELVAISLWRDDEELRERCFVSDFGVGLMAAAMLAELIKPIREDSSEARGRAGGRVEGWSRLVSQLDPILQEVLGPCADRSRHLRVFAPGALRSLPFLGLTLRGAPLFTLFGSISHLPSLGFDRRVPIGGEAHPYTVCTLASGHDHGETRFGEAAIGTLRRWFPPEIRAEAGRPEGADIFEATAVEAASERAEVIRFYGVGHGYALNPSTVGLLLPGPRTLMLANLRRLVLPRTRAVEIWASLGGSAEMLTTLAFDGDRLPSFVRSFLMQGAAGVLDLAWPVHDLVKAMVAECFGATRRLGSQWEPFALARAVEYVGRMLVRWKLEASGFATKEQALGVLDRVRMGAAAEAGLDPRAVIPFAPLADAPSLGATVEEMVAEVCDPVHLAAFRWWGA
ncbi:MAG: CHAT domain-containing protein [Pseudomonadota bacterium]